jgi:alanine racemase
MTRHHPIVAEIDLNSFRNNIQEIRRIIRPESKIIAVVKANAYGHGIIDMAEAALKSGADSLAVARTTEALQLRKNNVPGPILVFGYTTKDEIEPLITNNITFTVYDLNTAKTINDYAEKLSKQAIIHIKIDTGMSRLGFVSKIESLEKIRKIKELPNIYLEGIYTHFADADNYDKQYTIMQLKQFNDFLVILNKNNISIPIKHASNSAAIIDHPDANFDAVRPGIALYGLYPSEFVNKNKLNLIPVMTLKVQVAQVRTIPKGTKVGYGCRFTADHNIKIATLPIGYADGFTRMLKNGEVLVQGVKAPVIGTICMDQCMISVDHISDINIGDEVVIIGRQGNNCIKADDIAKKLNTINYEVACMISFRIPRIYTH